MPAPKSNTKVVLASLAGIAAMAGLVVASVPLYQLYCRVTGAGGTPRVEGQAPDAVSDRVVTIRFDSSLERGMPWSFKPVQPSMTVRIGEQALAFYHAVNLADHAVVGSAVFNVTPDKAGLAFNKTECFCFTQQRLEAGQSADMPVSFFVSPELAADVDTITLSYTFYTVPERQGRS